MFGFLNRIFAKKEGKETVIHAIDMDGCAAFGVFRDDNAETARHVTPPDLESGPANAPSLYQQAHAPLLSLIKPGDTICSASARHNSIADVRNAIQPAIPGMRYGIHGVSLTQVLPHIAAVTSATLDKHMFGDTGRIIGTPKLQYINAKIWNETTAIRELLGKRIKWSTQNNGYVYRENDQRIDCDSAVRLTEEALEHNGILGENNDACRPDKEKVLTLLDIVERYAEQHKASKKNPIRIEFYDACMDILEGLNAYYQHFGKNGISSLLPEGVTVHLNHYKPGVQNTPERKHTLIGNGPIYNDIPAAIRVLLAGKQETSSHSKLKSPEDVDQNTLAALAVQPAKVPESAAETKPAVSTRQKKRGIVLLDADGCGLAITDPTAKGGFRSVNPNDYNGNYMQQHTELLGLFRSNEETEIIAMGSFSARSEVQRDFWCATQENWHTTSFIPLLQHISDIIGVPLWKHLYADTTVLLSCDENAHNKDATYQQGQSWGLITDVWNNLRYIWSAENAAWQTTAGFGKSSQPVTQNSANTDATATLKDLSKKDDDQLEVDSDLACGDKNKVLQTMDAAHRIARDYNVTADSPLEIRVIDDRGNILDGLFTDLCSLSELESAADDKEVDTQLLPAGITITQYHYRPGKQDEPEKLKSLHGTGPIFADIPAVINLLRVGPEAQGGYPTINYDVKLSNILDVGGKYTAPEPTINPAPANKTLSTTTQLLILGTAVAIVATMTAAILSGIDFWSNHVESTELIDESNNYYQAGGVVLFGGGLSWKGGQSAGLSYCNDMSSKSKGLQQH